MTVTVVTFFLFVCLTDHMSAYCGSAGPAAGGFSSVGFMEKNILKPSSLGLGSWFTT